MIVQAYKIINRLSSNKAVSMYSDLFSIAYYENQTIYPEIEGTPIFAFESLKKASYCTGPGREFWKCEGRLFEGDKRVDKSKILCIGEKGIDSDVIKKFWAGNFCDLSYLMNAFDGTILLEFCKLIEKIPSDEVWRARIASHAMDYMEKKKTKKQKKSKKTYPIFEW